MTSTTSRSVIEDDSSLCDGSGRQIGVCEVIEGGSPRRSCRVRTWMGRAIQRRPFEKVGRPISMLDSFQRLPPPSGRPSRLPIGRMHQGPGLAQRHGSWSPTGISRRTESLYFRVDCDWYKPVQFVPDQLMAAGVERRVAGSHDLERAQALLSPGGRSRCRSRRQCP